MAPPRRLRMSRDEYATVHHWVTHFEADIEKRFVDSFNAMAKTFQAWHIAQLTPSRSTVLAGGGTFGRYSARDRSGGSVIRVDLRQILSDHNTILPSPDHSCDMRIIVAGAGSPIEVEAERTIDMVTPPCGSEWERMYEFRVGLPRNLRRHLSPVVKAEVAAAANGAEIKNMPAPRQARSFLVSLSLRHTESTKLAELHSLATMVRATPDSVRGQLFDYILGFPNVCGTTSPEGPAPGGADITNGSAAANVAAAGGRMVDLTEHYPQYVDRSQIRNPTTRDGIDAILSDFDAHQHQAQVGIANIPYGVFFVPGGPGAGKTHWVLTMAAIAHAGHQSGSVLYLLDINRSLDDAAAKMARLYQKLDIKSAVIRIRGWPMSVSRDTVYWDDGRLRVDDEMEVTRDNPDGSQRDHPGTPGPAGDGGKKKKKKKRVVVKIEDSNPLAMAKRLRHPKHDLVTGFLTQLEASMAGAPSPQYGTGRVMELDEAAWAHFLHNCYSYPGLAIRIRKIVMQVERGRAAEIRPEWQFHDNLFQLYRDTLQAAGFVAATPVSAFGWFANTLYSPDLVIFDEAGHARELSTLIAFANFTPKAFFLTGDYRQSQPWLSRLAEEMPIGRQVQMSLLERASLAGAVDCQLLINHRARAGLWELASELFYESEMRSGLTRAKQTPQSVQDLIERHLAPMSPTRDWTASPVPRVLVSVSNAYAMAGAGTSSWNPAQLRWAMAKARSLLEDPRFRTVDGTGRGTILLVSSYSEATKRYEGEIRRQFDADQQRRIQALTVGNVQGMEADVVMFDVVKGGQFSDEPHRLCVALTRAVQAEFIIMGVDARGNRMADYDWHNENLGAIWQLCYDDGQFVDVGPA